tara:strand:+ start:1836 stop:2528 length:693 start_codon:yes stop_codon:yes gene_type:complete
MNLIKTPWGSISTNVSLFPIYYLIFIYGFVYILPFGKNLVGLPWFYFLKKEDGILESLQFIQYLVSSGIGLYIYLRIKKKRSLDSFIWLIMSLLCFLIAGEEISWGERLTGISLNSITELSIQGETNIHNLPFFHNYLLDPVLQAICIFFGWIGWRKYPFLTSLPSKKLSLFFLLVSLFLAYYDLSWASTIEHIRDDTEIFEFLLSTGIFLHFWDNMKLSETKSNSVLSN